MRRVFFTDNKQAGSTGIAQAVLFCCPEKEARVVSQGGYAQ